VRPRPRHRRRRWHLGLLHQAKPVRLTDPEHQAVCIAAAREAAHDLERARQRGDDPDDIALLEEVLAMFNREVGS
jgi:hypothetical protein